MRQRAIWVLLLALFAPATWAEGPAAAALPGDPTRMGGLEARRQTLVEAAERATISDPTRLSPRFREALRHTLPAVRDTPSLSTGTALPRLSVAALAGGGGAQASAILRVDDRTYLVRSGTDLTVTLADGRAVTLRVQSVAEAEVRVQVLGREIVLR